MAASSVCRDRFPSRWNRCCRGAWGQGPGDTTRCPAIPRSAPDRASFPCASTARPKSRCIGCAAARVDHGSTTPRAELWRNNHTRIQIVALPCPGLIRPRFRPDWRRAWQVPAWVAYIEEDARSGQGAALKACRVGSVVQVWSAPCVPSVASRQTSMVNRTASNQIVGVSMCRGFRPSLFATRFDWQPSRSRRLRLQPALGPPSLPDTPSLLSPVDRRHCNTSGRHRS